MASNFSTNLTLLVSPSPGDLKNAVAGPGCSKSDGQKHTLNVQNISTGLDDPNSQLMLINPDRTLMFDYSSLSEVAVGATPVKTEGVVSLSASKAAQPNYLVVVENMDLQRNVLLSSDDDFSLPSIVPVVQAPTSSAENRTVPGELTEEAELTQHTITMIFENSDHGFKSNSFIAYSNHTSDNSEQMIFPVAQSIVLDKPDLFECSDGSFIDISSLSVVALEPPILSAPETATDSIAQTSKPGLGTNKNVSREQLALNRFTGPCSSDMFKLGNQRGSGPSLQNQQENTRHENLKQELRYLEQCHLEHHLKQAKTKLDEKQVKTNADEDRAKVTYGYNTILTQLNAEGTVNDETPVFSIITATLNAAVVAQLPGWRQLISDVTLDMSSSLESVGDNSFTFTGTLHTLIMVHNLLKKSLIMETRSMLELRAETAAASSMDKGVTCDLLMPYVSLRGRQPKCSTKAAEMSMYRKFYLCNDALEDSDVSFDRIKKNHAGKDNHKKSRIKKNKRMCVQRNVRPVTQSVTLQYPDKSGQSQECSRPYDRCILLNNTESCSNVDGTTVSHSLPSKSLSQTGRNTVMVSMKDMSDPTQRMPVEQQFTCQPNVGQAHIQMASIFPAQDEIVPTDIVLESSVSVPETTEKSSDAETKAMLNSPAVADTSPEKLDTHTHGDPQGNTDGEIVSKSEQNVMETVKLRRGRPRKLCRTSPPNVVEKVRPRNPLTESASTIQQRNYEENVSFKYFCQHCSFKTKRQSHFVSHLRCHQAGTESKYCCKQCDFVTISLPTLKRHELKHSKSLFKCGICAAYVTDREELLKRHFRLKHAAGQCLNSKENLSCEWCCFTCRTSLELERHKLKHDNRLSNVQAKDSQSCSECQKSFRSRMHLQRHVRDVHGPNVRPYLCDKCGKAFKRTDALQQHKLVHVSRNSRSFPFKCTSCEKGFRSPAHLKEHMSMHSSERPFLCQYCGASFKTQPVQKKHIQTLHVRPRAHMCSVCCRQFNTRHALQRHENTHTRSASILETGMLMVATGDEELASAGKLSVLGSHSNQLASLSMGGDPDPVVVKRQATSPVGVSRQLSSCMVQNLISSAIVTIQDPAEQTGQQTLNQSYLQGASDGTLYYLTGQLSSL